MRSSRTTRDMVLAALLLAMALVLPFLTGQIQQIGNMLLPMHLPVLLCGLICGWKYGAAVGFTAPLLRNLLFGMPPLFPIGIAMSFELAAYGLLVGLVYARAAQRGAARIYLALICAMAGGRVVWGVVRVAMSGAAGGEAFTWQMFLSGALLTAVPGIMVQLVLIPLLMLALERAGLLGRPAGEEGAV